jgi:hypothetical protein
MSGKHVKLREWRRGAGGTPVRSVVLGGAAWVSVTAVLAVAAPGEPPVEPGAGPAQPSPSTSTLPGGPDRDPVVSRSAGRGEARVLAAPSAAASPQAGVRELVGDVTDAGEDLAGTALTATAGATSTGLSASPSVEPEPSPDSSGPRPSEGGESGSGTPEPQPSDEPEPSDDHEPEDDEPEDDDEPSEEPGPTLDLPILPPVGLP